MVIRKEDTMLPRSPKPKTLNPTSKPEEQELAGLMWTLLLRGLGSLYTLLRYSTKVLFQFRVQGICILV